MVLIGPGIKKTCFSIDLALNLVSIDQRITIKIRPATDYIWHKQTLGVRKIQVDSRD